MQNKYLKGLLLFQGIFLIFLSCENYKKKNSQKSEWENSPVIEISWIKTGGDLGYYESVTVNRDSIKYFHTLGDSIFKKNISNTPKIWSEFLQGFDLAGMKKIRNGGSAQPFDGVDDIITLKTKSSADTITNGYEEGNDHPEIEKLKKQILKIKENELKIN